MTPPTLEFTTGGARALLEHLDAAIAQVESNVLEGRCKTMEQVNFFLGQRTAHHRDRTALLRQLDDDTKRMLGVPL